MTLPSIVRSENGTTSSTPPCTACGGSGYVYLWSVARAGNRTWYCDRHSCKSWWSDADPVAADVATRSVTSPTVARVEHQPLQPAASGSVAELVPA